MYYNPNLNTHYIYDNLANIYNLQLSFPTQHMRDVNKVVAMQVRKLHIVAYI